MHPHLLREVIQTTLVAWEGNALKASFELGSQLQNQNLPETEDESDDDIPILDDIMEASVLDCNDPPAAATPAATAAATPAATSAATPAATSAATPAATSAATAASGPEFAQMKAKIKRLQAMVTMLQSTRRVCANACVYDRYWLN